MLVLKTPTARLEGRPDAPERGCLPADAGSAAVGELAGGAPAEEAGAEGRHRPGDPRGERPAVQWGPYEPAIRRWEHLRGPAPAPTELNTKGGHRLSPKFAEWMMGLSAGWVTDTPGITRALQLKALGNGVVPQQAEAALTHMLTRNGDTP